jgi:hypothetical protein
MSSGMFLRARARVAHVDRRAVRRAVERSPNGLSHRSAQPRTFANGSASAPRRRRVGGAAQPGRPRRVCRVPCCMCRVACAALHVACTTLHVVVRAPAKPPARVAHRREEQPPVGAHVALSARIRAVRRCTAGAGGRAVVAGVAAADGQDLPGEPGPGADVVRGEPGPGADVARVSPVPVQRWRGASAVPVQTWRGASAVPVQMRQGRAQCWCRCGRGEPGPGAEVVAVTESRRGCGRGNPTSPK